MLTLGRVGISAINMENSLSCFFNWIYFMRRFRFFGIVLLINLFFINNLPAEPKLQVTQNYETKLVVTGTQIRGTLVLKNIGDQTLKIKGIKNACKCTSFRLQKYLINSGETIRVEFFVDTEFTFGVIEKKVKIYSSDPDSPWVGHISFHVLRKKIEDSDQEILFRPPCSTCHIDTANEQEYEALFQAVCRMCHAKTSIAGNRFRSEPIKTEKLNQTAYQTIFTGNWAHGMPGFGEYLSEQQIKSLVHYLNSEN